MEETINNAPSVTEQPQVETSAPSMEDKILSSFGGENKAPETNQPQNPETPTVETKTELTVEEKTALSNEAKELGLPETATKEEIEAKKTEMSNTPQVDEWKLDDVQNSAQESEEGSWKDLISEIGGEVPQDYSEEKGYEYFKQTFENRIKQEVESAQKFDKEVFLAEFPPEARLVMELVKSGQTLDQINAPFIEINNFKSMSDAEIVRNAYENTDGWDTEMVDHKMQNLDDAALSIEAKIIRKNIENYEKQLNQQREQQLNQYKHNQNQFLEQKRQRETLSVKTALDRVQTYMDKKIPDAIKPQLLQELSSDAFLNMPGTPEMKVDYLLYSKFGKQGMKDFEARVRDKMLLEQKSKQHNVPPITSGNANRVDTSSQGKTRIEQRIEESFGR